MKKWTVLSSDPDSVKEILNKTDLLPLTANVMSARGYNDLKSLSEFFDPTDLSDPYELADMEQAVETINDAIDAGEKICVYGDYDCDGVTASAILYDYLLNMGADVTYYIPERSEGYGLSVAAVDKLKAAGVSLIITVDNGISAIDEAEHINELGMKLVVTDHHQPSDKLPNACAVVDPHRHDDRSKFKDLAGVGVALKLLAALDDGNFDMVSEQYGDVTAIGTVADIVPLLGENRTIVSRGIGLLRNTENIGLLGLVEECGANLDNINSTTIAFNIAPRINAAGRFGSPSTAFKMLTSEDESAREFAAVLSSLNNMRRNAETDIELEIEKMIADNPQIAYQRVIVVSGDGWHHGVIGIVAARLMEQYEKPVIVISSDSDTTSRGSARSIKGFNIFKCFEYCKGLLEKYGGHECAGGFTVLTENIPALNERIEEYARLYHPKMPRYTLTADRLIGENELSFDAVSDLRRLEPYGAGNPEPLFAFSGAKIAAVVPLKNGEHTRLDIDYKGATRIKALMFRTKTDTLDFVQGDTVDIMGHLNVNSYKGVKSLSLIVSDIRLHGIRQEQYFAACDAYEAYKRGENVPAETLKKGLPTRDELALVYKLLKHLRPGTNVETLYARLVSKGINAFKLNIALDAFADAKLAVVTGAKRSASLLSVESKVDISAADAIVKLSAAIHNSEKQI